jgi:type IV secretion system protein VirB1
MDTTTLLALALTCAPNVHVETAHALVRAESSLNPYAIGVVGGRLERQPRDRAEALATAWQLQRNGWNFSVGLAQINRHNLPRLGLTLETAFDPCSNLQSMQAILGDCYERASERAGGDQQAVRRALSCYYSGNFKTGFDHGYVRRVVIGANAIAKDARPPP